MDNAGMAVHAGDSLETSSLPPSRKVRLSSPKIEARVRPKVLYVTPELADFVKVGGLGDLSAALPRAMLKDFDVRILIPGFPRVIESGHPMISLGSLPGYADIPECELLQITLPDGLVVFTLKHADLFERHGSPYIDEHGQDWPDNHIRFARLSLAAVQLAGLSDSWCPELLHLNDWPTALAAGYAHWLHLDIPSVFTIHNLAHQGIFPMDYYHSLGIPESALNGDEMEYYGQLALIKAGLIYANQITTVSHTYATEILTPEIGFGMDGALRMRAAEGCLRGIVNGIGSEWSSEHSPELKRHFSIHDLAGKQANKEYIEELFNLTPSEGPLFCIISRLVHQKGLDIIIATANTIVEHGGKLAILGTGEAGIEGALIELSQRYPDQISCHLDFDEHRSHNLFGGSDFLLMPSRYEPCGLSQMYAQKYGCLPVAHKTGGLVDTVVDDVTGILCDSIEPSAFTETLQRALAIYEDKEILHEMRAAAMNADFSWQQPVKEYKAVYDLLLKPTLQSAAS